MDFILHTLMHETYSVKEASCILKSVSIIDLLDILILFTYVKIQVKFSIHWISIDLSQHLKLGHVHLRNLS